MRRFHDEDDDDVWEEDPLPTDAPRRVRTRARVAEILDADDDFVVLLKPAGLPVGPADDGENEDAESPACVLSQVADALNARAEELRTVAGLDDGVSGVMLLARTAAAEQEFVRQIARRALRRTFLAIVRGAGYEPAGVIDLAIGADRRFAGQMRLGGPNARPAITEWTLRDRYAGFALLECRPQTERRHQIRLHLQAAGMPLAVDPEYGGQCELMLSSFKPDYHRSRRHEERPLIARVSLHAAALEFQHPRTSEARRFEAPLPKDFRATLNQLDKHGRIGMPPSQ